MSERALRNFRIYISPDDEKPWETIGRAIGISAAWPDPFTGEESGSQTVWNWIDKAIGGRARRYWEDAERGRYFICTAEVNQLQA